LAFGAGTCVQKTSGAIRCDGTDMHARFRPITLGPNLFRVIVSARRRSFPAPLSPADVVGVLVFGGAERQDQIGNCMVSGRGNQVVRCRESGVVMATVTPSATATATATLPPTPTPPPFCGGDCDGDSAVEINELITGLSILLGRTGIAACPHADLGGDGSVTIDEAVAATGNAVAGCGTYPIGPPSGVPVQIQLGLVGGSAGAQVTFSATLLTMGQNVAGTQNEISVDPLTPLVSCQPNVDIDKGATSFAFLPSGCTAGVNCTTVRTVVDALDNTHSIPDGSVLYSCVVAINAAAPDGTYPLVASNLLASTFGGRSIVALGANGAVVVPVLPPTPTPIPTHTASPTPTA
jgi:hypothetical protein